MSIMEIDIDPGMRMLLRKLTERSVLDLIEKRWPSLRKYPKLYVSGDFQKIEIWYRNEIANIDECDNILIVTNYIEN